MFYKKFFYYAKAVRERNSVRNLWRYLDFMVEKSAQPWNIQVNVDSGDGRLFRITDISFGKMDKSVHLHVDLSQPMNYPEFWENEGWKSKPNNIENARRRKTSGVRGISPRQSDTDTSDAE